MCNCGKKTFLTLEFSAFFLQQKDKFKKKEATFNTGPDQKPPCTHPHFFTAELRISFGAEIKKDMFDHSMRICKIDTSVDSKLSKSWNSKIRKKGFVKLFFFQF